MKWIHTGQVALALGLLISACAAQADDLVVSGAWVRQPPPRANAAAFMTIENTGKEPVVLTGVESDCCHGVEIHRTTLADGVASMDEVETLTLEPGKPVVFAPRGLHIMLMRPQGLVEGEQLALTLTFAQAAPMKLSLPIRRTAP